MGADDRTANALGMIDDRVAFRAEFMDEPAHAQFVVGIAALERVHFGMHQRLEFGGARNRALDALVHRRDLAAYGLADGHDALGGNRLRLCEAKGDLRHRPCGIAKVMGSRHHDGKGEEQHDRNDGPDEDRDHARHCNDIGHARRLPDLAAVEKLA